VTAEAAPAVTPPREAAAPPPESRLLRRLAGASAEIRVLRVMAFGFLPGAVLFGLLLAPDVHAQMHLFPAWWVQAVLAGVVITPSLLGAVAFVAPVWLLRVVAGVSALAALAAQATFPLIAQSWPHALESAPWIDDITSLGTIASAIALPAAGAVLVSAASALLTVVDRITASHGDVLPGVQNGLYVLFFCITFVALGISSMRAGRAADAAEAAALRAATTAAADAARERERGRINALVHDRVLATLLAAAHDVPGSELLRQQDAQRALDGLQELLEPDHDPISQGLRGEEFAWRIQGITTEAAPEAVFGYEVDHEMRLPPEAVEALIAATEEALRNSLLHAGKANRTVHVSVGRSGVQVDVLDDGAGFDPSRVPATRLGISESIRGRMAALDGGSAVVISAPAVGTRVQLRYRPEPA
jgi:signal transduction histidine kinase